MNGETTATKRGPAVTCRCRMSVQCVALLRGQNRSVWRRKRSGQFTDNSRTTFDRGNPTPCDASSQPQRESQVIPSWRYPQAVAVRETSAHKSSCLPCQSRMAIQLRELASIFDSCINTLPLSADKLSFSHETTTSTPSNPYPHSNHRPPSTPQNPYKSPSPQP